MSFVFTHLRLDARIAVSTGTTATSRDDDHRCGHARDDVRAILVYSGDQPGRSFSDMAKGRGTRKLFSEWSRRRTLLNAAKTHDARQPMADASNPAGAAIHTT